MRLAGWIALFAAAAAPVFVVVDSWGGGKPLVFALGGFFPLTDGAMWWTCGLQLAGLGGVPGPFGWVTFDSSGYCTNRPSHTGLLATLQMLAGFDPHVLLLLLALIIGISMAYLAAQVARTFGALAGVVSYLLVLAYASEHSLSMFVSESTGLFLGALGLAFLVRFIRTDAWPDAWFGIAILSIGLFTRAGAMLALALLLLWVLWHAKPRQGRDRYWFLLKGVGCILAGFLLQRTLLALIGDPSRGHLSNFSFFLYGLATGSRDWREALVMYGVETPWPVEVMNMIMPLAISKMLAQPGTFLASLAGAEGDYLATLFRVPLLQPIEYWLMVPLALGLIGIAISARQRGYQALCLVAFGEALSAPLIYDADGLRVFAATFPVRCLLAAVGVSMLYHVLAASLRRGSMRQALAAGIANLRNPASVFVARSRLAAPVFAGIVLAALFAATPLARPFRLEPVTMDNTACPDASRPVALIANRASTSLFINGDPSEHGRSGRISVASLDREIRDAWFREDFEHLPHNTLLIRTIDRNPSNFGREISILWMNADPDVRDGDVLRFCLLPHLTRAPHRRFVRLAYHRFFLAVPSHFATLAPTTSEPGSRSR